MIEFYLTKEELEKALRCLERAHERGFVASKAIFGLIEAAPWSLVARGLTEERYEFMEQLLLRADPTDKSKDWGRVSQEQIGWQRYENGVIVNE
jgi:hypothetical protein